jgi:5-methylcytosine-specific restriction protein A
MSLITIGKQNRYQMKVAVQPCSDKAGRDNFRATVLEGAPLTKLLKHLPEAWHQDLNKDFGEAISVFGVTNGKQGRNIGRWESLEKGDTVLFYRNKRIFYSARIWKTIKSAELSEELWGSKEDGERWENLYILTEGELVEITIEEYNSCIGYNSQNVIQGFHVHTEIESQKIIKLASENHEPKSQPQFEPGKIYNRKRDIHGAYGGQERGGISTPKSVPSIFLFTGNSGSKYGYQDGFDSNGIFNYSGEGTDGDMAMQKGNLAILDHELDGKTLLVFEDHAGKSPLKRFIGQFRCIGYTKQEQKDQHGTTRKAIVFKLQRVLENQATALLQKDNEATSNKKSRRYLEELLTPTKHSTYKSEVTIRRRCARLREIVLDRANGICEGCSAVAPFETKEGPYLEAHHVNQLSDDGEDTPDNVIALCPNCHRKAHHSIDRDAFQSVLKAHLESIYGHKNEC